MVSKISPNVSIPSRRSLDLPRTVSEKRSVSPTGISLCRTMLRKKRGVSERFERTVDSVPSFSDVRRPRPANNFIRGGILIRNPRRKKRNGASTATGWSFNVGRFLPPTFFVFRFVNFPVRFHSRESVLWSAYGT